MAFNLLDSVSTLFNGDLVSKTASALGENESSIQKALGGAIPSVLAGFLNKASSSDGINSIFNFAKQAGGSGILNNLSGLLGGNDSSLSGLLGMAGNLFGDKLGNIGNLLSSFSGIKPSSASSLLNMVTPAALGSIGKHISETNIGTSGFASFLASQKDSIIAAIPSGLNLAGALGLGSLSGIGSKLSSFISSTKDSIPQAVHAVQSSPKKTNWLLPVILAVAGLALILYFFKSCGNENTIPPPAGDTTTVQPSQETNTTPVESIRESFKVKLPDGTELDAYKGGIEDALVTYLSSSDVISKEKWFDFDNLNFETGSATITPASLKQVQNIAAILKAYPKVKIKIGGYTDNTGDSTANVQLSQSRAAAVLNKLNASGNPKQLDGAEGYGPTHFIAPNDTEDNKKKNRRISINVREK